MPKSKFKGPYIIYQKDTWYYSYPWTFCRDLVDLNFMLKDMTTNDYKVYELHEWQEIQNVKNNKK